MERGRGIYAGLVATIRSRLRALTDDPAHDVLEETLRRIIECLTPLHPIGIGWMISRLRDVMHWHAERSGAMRQLGDSTLLEGPSDIAGAVATSISALTDGVLPAVIAVEDLHHAGEDTVSLLARLEALDAKVTVLATAWQESNHHENYRRLLIQLNNTTSIQRVDEPKQEAVARLIRYFAPLTLEAEAKKIALRWPNPFALLTMLTLPRLQRWIERQSGRL